MGRKPFRHRLAGTQLILPDEHGHVAAVFGQKHGFLRRGVAATDDDEMLVSENGDGAVADSAGADAILPVFVFTEEVEAARGSACSDD